MQNKRLYSNPMYDDRVYRDTLTFKVGHDDGSRTFYEYSLFSLSSIFDVGTINDINNIQKALKILEASKDAKLTGLRTEDKNGLRQGDFVESKHGDRLIAHYKDGLLDGPYRTYRRDRLIEKRQYECGKPVGKHDQYHPGTGRLTDRRTYDDKDMMVMESFDENEKITVQTHFILHYGEKDYIMGKVGYSTTLHGTTIKRGCYSDEYFGGTFENDVKVGLWTVEKETPTYEFYDKGICITSSSSSKEDLLNKMREMWSENKLCKAGINLIKETDAKSPETVYKNIATALEAIGIEIG